MSSGQDILGLSGFTGSLGKAGLAIATTTTAVQIAAPNGNGLDFAIDGVAYHKADTDNISLTATSVQAVSTSCLYMCLLNSSGTLSSVKGNEVLTANLGVVGGTLQWPSFAESLCPIGGFKVALNASTTFTGGTTALDNAGVTDTYYDFGIGIPLAPQTS